MVKSLRHWGRSFKTPPKNLSPVSTIIISTTAIEVNSTTAIEGVNTSRSDCGFSSTINTSSQHQARKISGGKSVRSVAGKEAATGLFPTRETQSPQG